MTAPRLDRVDLGFALALTLVFFAIILSPIRPKALGDLDFHQDAQRLASTMRGAETEPPQLARAIGPVLWYTAPYLVVPPEAADRAFWRVAVAWNAVALFLAMLLLRRAGDRLGGPAAGVTAAGLGVLLSPMPVYYAFGVLAETPAFLGAALLAWGGAVAITAARGERGLAVAGIAAGLVLLLQARPNVVLVLPLGILATVLAYRFSARRAASRLIAAALVAATVAILVIPAVLGAKRQVDFLSFVALIGRFQFREEPWDWRFWDDSIRGDSADYQAWQATSAAIEQAALASGEPLHEAQRRWVVDDLRRHPLTAFKMAAVRTLSIHVSLIHSLPAERLRLGPIPGSVTIALIHAAINFATLAMVAGSVIFLFRRRRDDEPRGRILLAWPLWAPWLAIVVFHGIIYAEPRYLLPARAGLAVMAGVALAPWGRHVALVMTGLMGHRRPS